MIALYRFWPEAYPAVRQTIETAEALRAENALPLAEVALTLGAYDLAIEIADTESVGETASRALAVAEAIVEGRVGNEGGHWAASATATGIAIPKPETNVFSDIPEAVPFLLLRAMGGWNIVASPDRDTWLTLSMTFLNRRAYQRFDTEGAWFSPDVNELASLVMGTHNTQDVEGTCLTYGIPGLSLVDWEDERQATLIDRKPEETRSALLAEELRYAALLPTTRTSLREALEPLGSQLFVED
ncbi:MAG: hypothetical protein CL897_04250 [Dehalococcoidia bacterium]|nr:hypothetical protein [Dehalococcoidia bacterium]HCU99913.1 hypothetical protein [Dehalococcoidia bacterium]|tara:strand:- start:100 stop:828 length:729 start_codon:yes stop_codon:yes gene_type:complete